MPRNDGHRETGRDAVLRIASHNVRGLSQDKARILARAWRQNDLDIILLQETHVNNLHKRAAIEPILSQYAIVWSLASSRACRGVAICFRRAALARRGLQWDGSATPGHNGSSIAASLRWAGHTIRILNVHFPSISTDQKEFIRTCVANSMSNLARGEQLLVGGDFNFVLDSALDRFQQPGDQRPRPPDPTAAYWTECVPSLVDVLRAKWPRRHQFTWFSPSSLQRSASRIDRFYVTPEIASFVRPMRPTTCTPNRRPVFRLSADADHVSDHAMVGVTLSARAPVQGGQSRTGTGRVRLRFEECETLKQDFRHRLALLIGALPTDGVRLIQAWPKFKQDLAQLVRYMNGLVGRVTRDDTRDRFVAIMHRSQAGDAAALAELPQARRRLVQADQLSIANTSTLERRQWLHDGERPGPLLSAQLQTPRGALEFAAGRIQIRGLATDPRQLAGIMASHLAGIAQAQPCDEGAQAEVLQCIEPTRRLIPAQAACLENRVISVGEVQRALAKANPGTAPGPDGLPMDLWRKYRGLLSSPLACLFSAIAGDDGMPNGFNAGSIIALFKSGDRTDPANYRPITLLNADYRAFARVQASRLSPVLTELIDPHQTAFLPGRLIGENVWVAQTLPTELARARSGAISVACDFRKAYDTVDREFLLKIMKAMGCGPCFLRVVRMLLSDTRARVDVNGTISASTEFEAGVRQGCPLAPLLYLFVGQAMSCFLASRGVGIHVAGTRLVVTQFADDTMAYLQGWARVSEFLALMHIFGRASGQHLNRSKTRVIPMGNLAEVAAPSDSGLGVDARPQVLGIPLSSDLKSGARQPCVDWGPRLRLIVEKLHKLSNLPISAFGRAFAASSYALSSLLYVAEFAGPPPASDVDTLQQQVAALVDAKYSPKDQGNRGFVGISAVNQLGSPLHGGFGVLPLRQHITARHAVWGVRLVMALLGDKVPPWALLARAQLATLRRNTLIVGQHAGITDIFFYDPTPAEKGGLSPIVRLMFHALRKLPEPRIIANAQLPPSDQLHTPRGLELHVMSVWSWPAADGGPDIPLRRLTVRAATRMLTAQQLNPRRTRQHNFWQEAQRLAAAPQNADTTVGSRCVGSLLSDMWRAPCCNAVKEPYWRLVVNAMPTAQRRFAQDERCACGAAFPGRAHHWWECPVAVSTRLEIQRQLTAFAMLKNEPVQQLTAVSVWLAEVPRNVWPWIWRVVCLSAIAAMDHGRAAMAAQILSASVSRRMAVHTASNSSVTRFWALLEEAAAARRLPAPPAATIVQPFFRFRNGEWTVNRIT